MSQNENEKPIYQTPIVVPLGEMAAAHGVCSPGSGDVQCSNGTGAGSGGSVGGQCNTGTSPGGECEVGSLGTTKCERGISPLNQADCAAGPHPTGLCVTGTNR